MAKNLSVINGGMDITTDEPNIFNKTQTTVH